MCIFVSSHFESEFCEYVNHHIKRYPYLSKAKIRFGRITAMRDIDIYGEKELEGYYLIKGKIEKFSVPLFREEEFYIEEAAIKVAREAIKRGINEITRGKKLNLLNGLKIYLNSDISIPKEFRKLNGFIIHNTYLEEVDAGILVQVNKKRKNRKYFVLFSAKKIEGNSPIDYLYDEHYVPSYMYIYNVKIKEYEKVPKWVNEKVRKKYFISKEIEDSYLCEKEEEGISKKIKEKFLQMSDRLGLNEKEKNIILQNFQLDWRFCYPSKKVYLKLKLIETNGEVDVHNEIAGNIYWKVKKSVLYKEGVKCIGEYKYYNSGERCGVHRDGRRWTYIVADDNKLGHILTEYYDKEFREKTCNCQLTLYKLTKSDTR